MGIFDFFGSKGGKAALRKQAQKVTEKYGPPENRQKVIEQLAELGSAEALSVLCLRFTIRAEPGITDDEEKERVRQILVDAGDAAVAPVKEFLEAQESGVSWGLRVLSELRRHSRRRAAAGLAPKSGGRGEAEREERPLTTSNNP